MKIYLDCIERGCSANCGEGEGRGRGGEGRGGEMELYMQPIKVKSLGMFFWVIVYTVPITLNLTKKLSIIYLHHSSIKKSFKHLWNMLYRNDANLEQLFVFFKNSCFDRSLKFAQIFYWFIEIKVKLPLIMLRNIYVQIFYNQNICVQIYLLDLIFAWLLSKLNNLSPPFDSNCHTVTHA